MGSLLHFSAFWLWSSLRSMEAMEVTAMEATAMEACLVAFMEVSDRSWDMEDGLEVYHILVLVGMAAKEVMGMAARGVTAMEAVDTRDLLIPTQLLHLVQ